MTIPVDTQVDMIRKHLIDLSQGMIPKETKVGICWNVRAAVPRCLHNRVDEITYWAIHTEMRDYFEKVYNDPDYPIPYDIQSVWTGKDGVRRRELAAELAENLNWDNIKTIIKTKLSLGN